MKYGQLAGNRRINDTIYRCFEHLREEDVRKFVQKFRKQPHDQNQVLHTFRELLVGAFLASNGFNVRYDHEIDGKTPDWSILNDALEALCIIEVTNFHIDKVTEDAMKQKVEFGDTWCGFVQPNNDRLYQRLQEKNDKYEKLAKKHNISYVVAVFGDFMADLEPEELQECLFKDHTGGLFKQCPTLSGVLSFEESLGQYIFKYIQNPKPDKPICFPSRVF
jgi:hypothetical protein